MINCIIDGSKANGRQMCWREREKEGSNRIKEIIMNNVNIYSSLPTYYTLDVGLSFHFLGQHNGHMVCLEPCTQ